MTPETNAGHFLHIEYDVGDDTWQAKSKKTYRHIPDKVKVQYNPYDPADVAIDGYYESGMGKYLFLAGALLLFLMLAYMSLVNIVIELNPNP